MALFDRNKKAPVPQIPDLWPYAKEITKKEADAKSVPIGWYIYQDGYMWRGLKPDPEGGFNRYSPSVHEPEQLEEWLGVPVRPLVQEAAPSFADQVDRAEEQLQPAVDEPSEIEERWAEEKLAEEIREIDREIEEAAALLAASMEPATPRKTRKTRKSLGRTNQVKTRLTDDELLQFQRRVKKTGMTQGDFLRSIALTGEIRIEERNVADVALLDELALIRAELGRQGGLLKMVIRPNEGQRELAPAEWRELIDAVRGMEQMRNRISELEVRIQHGDPKAQGKQE